MRSCFIHECSEILTYFDKWLLRWIDFLVWCYCRISIFRTESILKPRLHLNKILCMWCGDIKSQISFISSTTTRKLFLYRWFQFEMPCLWESILMSTKIKHYDLSNLVLFSHTSVLYCFSWDFLMVLFFDYVFIGKWRRFGNKTCLHRL